MWWLRRSRSGQKAIAAAYRTYVGIFFASLKIVLLQVWHTNLKYVSFLLSLAAILFAETAQRARLWVLGSVLEMTVMRSLHMLTTLWRRKRPGPFNAAPYALLDRKRPTVPCRDPSWHENRDALLHAASRRHDPLDQCEQRTVSRCDGLLLRPWANMFARQYSPAFAGSSEATEF